MKQRKVFSVIIYTAIIFAGMLMYCFINGFGLNNIGLYSLFLGDFSIGICSRLLVGSVISIFKETITREWLISFLRVVTVAVFLVTAHYAGSTLSVSEKTNRKSLTLFTLLFVICPFSITVFAGDIFGFIDIFCMLVLLMTAYFSENSILVFLIPVLFVTGIFIHDSYITGYMAPCFGILAYVIIKKYGKKLWASLIFIFSAVLSVATCIYSVAFSRKTVTMTADEMLVYLAEKGNTTINDVSGYLEDMLLYTDVRQVAPEAAERNTFNHIKYMIKYALEGLSERELLFFISIIPLVALIFFVWIKAAKNSEGFMEKVPYILFMLTPVPQLLSLIMSIDFTRFLSTIVITQVFYLFLCVRQKDNLVTEILSSLGEKIHYFAFPTVFVLLANMFV